MTLTKIVNGQPVELSPAEESALRSDWAAHDAARSAIEAENLRKAEVEQAIAGDSVVHELKGMNNAEFDAWWAANVTTLAQANTVLKRLARIVVRRVL
jgi:hypothetical protein